MIVNELMNKVIAKDICIVDRDEHIYNRNNIFQIHNDYGYRRIKMITTDKGRLKLYLEN